MGIVAIIALVIVIVSAIAGWSTVASAQAVAGRKQGELDPEVTRSLAELADAVGELRAEVDALAGRHEAEYLALEERLDFARGQNPRQCPPHLWRGQIDGRIVRTLTEFHEVPEEPANGREGPADRAWGQLAPTEIAQVLGKIGRAGGAKVDFPTLQVGSQPHEVRPVRLHRRFRQPALERERLEETFDGYMLKRFLLRRVGQALSQRLSAADYRYPRAVCASQIRKI